MGLRHDSLRFKVVKNKHMNLITILKLTTNYSGTKVILLKIVALKSSLMENLHILLRPQHVVISQTNNCSFSLVTSLMVTKEKMTKEKVNKSQSRYQCLIVKVMDGMGIA